ncbi:MAG TPA: GNAT family N-acetyltransferase [Victivallales bacterium]|nr:GNAT family N-acetyltransferase [Victivallales bacterium]
MFDSTKKPCKASDNKLYDNQIIIRKIKENEMEELYKLYLHFPIDPKHMLKISREKHNKIWERIKNNPCVNYFVADADEKIVGTCILTITPSIFRGGDGYAVIEHVVTHSDYRRRGIARAMMEYAIKYAWEHGCTEILLLSGVNFKGAHKLYESLGFDQSRRKGFILDRPGLKPMT